MDVIELEGMEFRAFHGCLEQERRDGNLFTVDFRGEIDLRLAAQSDDLADTADYGKIYDTVAAQMAVPSNLLENVAGRIADAIQKEFTMFARFSVRVSKQNPPVAGKAQWSRITIER